MLGREAAIDVVAVGPEILRLRRTQNVPKAVQQMRRAVGRSPSDNGRMTAFILFSYSANPNRPFSGANGPKTQLFYHRLMPK